MTYTGKTTRTGKCAICKDKLPVGTLVYFDNTKNQGNHLAHIPCFDRLKSNRPPAVGKKKKVEVKSTEHLDAPF